MTYIIPDGFVDDLRNFKDNYELVTKTSLNQKPPYAISTVFGAKDISTRKQQILFVQNMVKILEPQIKSDLSFASEEEIADHIYALRVLVSVCLFIKSQIGDTYTVRSGSNSTLTKLINSALKLSKQNMLDKESQACALLAAERYLKHNDCAGKLGSLQGEKSSDILFSQFSLYIKEQCAKLNYKYEKYPMTAIMIPLFATPMQVAGCTTGYIIGDMMGKSTSLQPARQAVTAAFGGGLLFLMGPSAGVGVLLFAPTYAGKLLETFCGVSTAYVLGTAMSILGTGVGWGVGMSLDVSWKLLYSACSMLASAYQGETPLAKLTGFTLAAPRRVIDGVQLEVKEIADIESQTKNFIFTSTPEGLSLQIGEDRAVIPWTINEEEPCTKKLRNLLAEEPLQEEDNMYLENLFDEKSQEVVIYLSS